MKSGSLKGGHRICTLLSTVVVKQAKQVGFLVVFAAVACSHPCLCQDPSKIVGVGRKLLGFEARRLEALSGEQNGTSTFPVGEPLIIADGGLQYLYPEMTLHAYEAAMDGGADFLLCTLANTADNQAVCRPSFNLKASTNVGNRAGGGHFTSNFTLKEIKDLYARQTKAWGRTDAFEERFPVATPDEVIHAIRVRRAEMPWAKQVGLALCVEDPPGWKGEQGTLSTMDMSMKLLKKYSWEDPLTPLMLISTSPEPLKGMQTNHNVARLLKFPEDNSLSPQNFTIQRLSSDALAAIRNYATGILLPRTAVLSQREKVLYGVKVQRAFWEPAPLQAVAGAGLSAFLYDFANDDPDFIQGVNDIGFNSFLRDPLSMYVNLFHDNNDTHRLVRGILTAAPTTAATAAACYRPSDEGIHPPVGVTRDRPLIISSGGSQGTMPSQTKLSYLEAIREGADFIDCNLQLTSDDVLFCHSEVMLQEKTNVDKIPALASFKRSYQVDSNPQSDWYSFDLTWKQVQTLRVHHSVARETTFSDLMPILKLDEFIEIALNASRTVGIFIKLDNPTFLAVKLPVRHDMVSLLLATLRKYKYLDGGNVYIPGNLDRPLIIASFDQCGLQNVKTFTSGTVPLVQKFSGGNWFEPCEKFYGDPDRVHPSSWWITTEGLRHIATYAGGINPPRSLILNVVKKAGSDSLAKAPTTDSKTAGFLNPNKKSTLIKEAKRLGLKVYPKAFQNDHKLGQDSDWAYDYLGDPTLEMQLYYDQFGVDGLEAQFVATAASFFRSRCRSWTVSKAQAAVGEQPWRFNLKTVDVGALYREADAEAPAPAPAPEAPLPPPPAGPVKRGGTLSNKAWVLVIVICVLVAVLSSCVVCFLFWKRRSRLRIIRDRQSSIGAKNGLKLFTWAELSAITNNFGPENRLGSGAFATVYKGVLPCGMPVAIKRLGVTESDKKDALAVRQLQNEVSIIGTVHNRNVVTLQGYSVDKEWLLVYDLMPNGSLQDALWDPEYKVQISWQQWYNIIIGIAQGLRYLHEECEYKIIHRDIKPANILLDAKLNPRVADFGLARNSAAHETHASTKVMGTFGYVAPDYALTGHLTEKSDVYSYGVLLMTIITGLHPIWPDDICPKGQQEITIDWVQEKAALGVEDLLTVINPKFKEHYDRDQAIKWLYVSLVCTQSQPVLRPSMRDVVQMLMGKEPIPEICISPARVVFPKYLNLVMGTDSEDEDRSTGW